MFFIPASLVGHKRKSETISCLAPFVLILCALVHSNQAGVIKKRDAAVAVTESGNIDLDSQLTDVSPTILAAVHNATEVVTTKLQSVKEANFEVSKDLTNNEILVNEAKKLLEEEDKIINLNNETELKAKENVEKGSEKQFEEEDDSTTNISGQSAKSFVENLQDIKQIILNLENKEQNLSSTPRITTDFSSNDIKENKNQMLMEKQSSESTDDLSDNENSSSLENSLKIHDERPRPPSRILTELRTATEAPVTKTQLQQTQLENSIENSKEGNPNDSRLEANEKSLLLNNETSVSVKISPIGEVSGKPLEANVTADKNEELISKSNTLETSKSAEEILRSETLDTTALSNKMKEQSFILETADSGKEILRLKSLDTTTSTNNIKQQRSTPQPQVNENLEITTLSSLEGLEIKSLSFSTENSLNENFHFDNADNKSLTSIAKNTLKQDVHLYNIQHDGLNHEELLKSNEVKEIASTNSKSLHTRNDTTMQPKANEEDLLILEGNKKQQYARSMFTEEPTTSNPNNIKADLLIPITTYKPPTLNIKEVKEEPLAESLKHNNVPTNINLKEKKPKFINDNSTNSQQLNLPYNTEVWSLAAMKSLPKGNVTIETNQAHNQTSRNHEKIALHNATLNMNSNSEKNLLDWSQIMMDKDLSTTTRNEDYKQHHLEEGKVEKQNQENHLTDKDSKIKEEVNDKIFETSTETSKVEITEFKMEDAVTMNTLIQPEITSTTISSNDMSTILSYSDSNKENNNASQTDKKVEDYMNNHIEIHMETVTVATTAATNMDENLFNTSVNIEPNLKEINLTSNQTENHLNNDVHQTITAGKQNFANAQTNTVATMMMTTARETTTTTTDATAVSNMTTVEQISSETTTVSTTETSKQNATLNNIVLSQQHQQNESINDVNLKEFNSSLENNIQENLNNTQNNQSVENIKLNSKVITTTTTVLPITTFRPTILTITSTTSSIPATFKQEVDQNGNETEINSSNIEQKVKQKQSIIQKTDKFLYDNNSTKLYETHLLEREFETTTTTTLETITTTPAISELQVNKTTNTLTSSMESITTTTTTQPSRDETTEINSDSKETTTTTQTTPKQVDETTIWSDVITEENTEGKGTEIFTKTTQVSSILSIEPTKAPVVIATEGAELKESSTASTNTATTTEQNIIATTTVKQESEIKEDFGNDKNAQVETTTMSSTTTTTTMPELATTTKDDETYISLLDDTTTTTVHIYSPTTFTTTTSPTTTTTTSSLTSTLPSPITTKVEEIYNVIQHSTTTELIQTTTQQLLTEIEESIPSSTTISSNTHSPEMIPPYTTTPPSNAIATADIGKSLPTLTSIMGGNSGNIYPKNSEASGETDINVIIAITVSVVGVVALVLLVGFLYLMRKRQKQNSYPNRCRPVSMDEFTIDNASVGGSMRKSSALRSSKRTYGNLAFDDPSLRHNAIGVHELAKFVQEKLRIFEEFRDVPQIISRLDEVPPGCEDKNRYANVLPLPETRVILQRLNDDEKTEYINANYVTGPKDPPNYYIACQAPLDSTVEDFWRMIWEQQSRVIIQATDLIENGVEKCAEYLPPSVTLDNHSNFGDFQITLQNREVKDKYAISTIILKNVSENVSRELTHYWYKWPEVGVPSEEAPIIAMLLEARSSLISYAIEQANEDKEKSSMATLKSAEEGTVSNNSSTLSPTNNSNGTSANGSTGEINGNISMVNIKKSARNQGPLTVHCSPGTGRTGTIIACDIAIRSLETPKRTVDIPQIVYYVRRGRASAVLTKEQYEFIYKVANMYAAKITNPTNYN